MIKDPSAVESDLGEVRGLNLLPVVTTLEREKIVRKVTGTCLLNNRKIEGYEIHMGKSVILKGLGRPFLRIHVKGEKGAWEDGWTINAGQIAGTYVHGVLDSPGFRESFLNQIRWAKGLESRAAKRAGRSKSHQYDRLADHFEAHCDVEKIVKIAMKGC